jgi:4,5-DOPA dioxygenase extradiol
MPVLFVGHGSPMNAIEENESSRGWRETAHTLPAPKAILCISAHWETRGVRVTAMEKPRTIHDFGGFPEELYRVLYPAPGSRHLAAEIAAAVKSRPIAMDEEWGLDHGCWSVLRRMYPKADIPVVQLSLDRTAEPKAQCELAGELAPFRRKGVLILGSGNMVHNLGMVSFKGGQADFNSPFGYDWALEAGALFKKLILERRHDELIRYRSLGRSVQLAIPTAEHYLPMLYALALRGDDEPLTFFNDFPLAGSLTMTSMVIGASG